MSLDHLHQLLKEQARAYICGKLDHSWKFALPVQKRDESQEVLAICSTCEDERWVRLPPEGYQEFLKDLAAGKIK